MVVGVVVKGVVPTHSHSRYYAPAGRLGLHRRHPKCRHRRGIDRGHRRSDRNESARLKCAVRVRSWHLLLIFAPRHSLLHLVYMHSMTGRFSGPNALYTHMITRLAHRVVAGGIRRWVYRGSLARNGWSAPTAYYMTALGAALRPCLGERDPDRPALNDARVDMDWSARISSGRTRRRVLPGPDALVARSMIADERVQMLRPESSRACTVKCISLWKAATRLEAYRARPPP